MLLPGTIRGAALAVVAVAVLTGCSASTSSSTCAEGRCTIALQGDGASTTVGVQEIEVELAGVADGRADLLVDGSAVLLGQGESAPVGPFTLTCTAIEGEAVSLTLE